MSSILISDLRPVGYELFDDSENYMRELSEGEFNSIKGGTGCLVVSGIVLLSGVVAFTIQDAIRKPAK